MKWFVTCIFLISLLMLLITVFKKKLGISWLTWFGSHLALSAMAIYIINFSGLISEVYIPLNPMTVGTVMMLGLPGIAVLIGLKLTLI
ncbi:pro-sigmaK processing inhibitor BofA family protein [Paenibacillus lemnae]|uniref:Pro-sigmaK processing inhibitor BofA n=1 Tax=Paenibacillus lemnae TaxID=1330551 RepID=A0A848MCG6_PAELE|nr:pro-sigmaK processing inhibitor BofA family protein [Paenibacillus lemnae]NMO97929.1 pro-sigmaK processing inhibitor BofA [Paenibacillus lemnae]